MPISNYVTGTAVIANKTNVLNYLIFDDGDILMLQDGKRLTSVMDPEPQLIAAFTLNNMRCRIEQNELVPTRSPSGFGQLYWGSNGRILLDWDSSGGLEAASQ